jgi:hypothetical protein
VYKVSVGRPQGKRPLGRPKSGWEDGIWMDLRKIRWCMWSEFSWLRILTDGGLLWTRWWIFGFWRHGVSWLKWRKLVRVRSQVFAEASKKTTTVFWYIASCSLVEVDRRFSDTYCLHTHRSDDWDSTLVCNVCVTTRVHGAVCQKATSKLLIQLINKKNNNVSVMS